jgi:hypothetical protein
MDMDEFLKPIFPFNNFENKIRVIWTFDLFNYIAIPYEQLKEFIEL